MVRPPKLDPSAVDAWLLAHPGWQRVGDALERAFRFPDFASALAFTVRVGMLAEKRDHHPDVLVGWGKAKVLWTTHDAGGITALDLELASATDGLAGSA
jgi:4a-hydroxytetrahydrobiopterin dehydratase